MLELLAEQVLLPKLFAATGEEGRYLLRALERPYHVALSGGIEEESDTEVWSAAEVAHCLYSSHGSGEGTMDNEEVVRVAVACG